MGDIFRDTFLGFVRIHLLHHAANAPVFGLEMIEELREHGYRMSPGTLYPILHKMQEEGYLALDEQVVSGKVRKYYRATAFGKRELDKLREKLRELTEEVLE